jgi:co-chaperonin GroES (HSP10)
VDILGTDEEEAPGEATQPSSAYRFNVSRQKAGDGAIGGVVSPKKKPSPSQSGRVRMTGNGGKAKKKSRSPKDAEDSTTEDEEVEQKNGSVTEISDEGDEVKVKSESPRGAKKPRGSLIGEEDPIGDFERLVARGGDVYTEIIDGSELLGF